MDLAELKILTGNRHPWEVARARTLNYLLRKSKKPTGAPNILDIGCGDGFTVNELFGNDHRATIDAVDTSLTEELISAFSAQYPTVSFHNSTSSLKTDFYDFITIFDVIEHTADDVAFLREIHRHAAPGAIFILTAPAFNFLYSNHDSYLDHHRRYNIKQLEKAILSAGLTGIRSGYLFSSLLLVRSCSVLWEKLTSGNKDFAGVATWGHGRLLTSLLSNYLTTENKMSLWLNFHGITIPGLSVWAIAQKPQ